VPIHASSTGDWAKAGNAGKHAINTLQVKVLSIVLTAPPGCIP